ncbi:hypothetical protein DsansV1_C09g0087641 [Dioscorea sansibarensis]
MYCWSVSIAMKLRGCCLFCVMMFCERSCILSFNIVVDPYLVLLPESRRYWVLIVACC